MQTTIAASYASRMSAIATDAETALAADVANIGPVTYDATALAFAHRYAYCGGSGTPTGSGGALYIPPYTAVNLLLVDPLQLAASVGGGFSATDLFPQGVANCFGAKNNEAPTLTLGLNTAYTNVDYFVLTKGAHEFAHPRDLLLGHPDYANIYQKLTTEFLEHPQTYSILGMNGFEDGTFSPYRYGNYGAAYLLMRYTADRYGTAFVKTYLQSDSLADEVWHVHDSDPFRLILRHPDGSSEDVVMGRDLAAGQRVQFTVPVGVWQAGELLPGGRFALYGCTMAPGFTNAGFEALRAARLAPRWPARAAEIERLSIAPPA